jgi:hypothetical protein
MSTLMTPRNILLRAVQSIGFIAAAMIVGLLMVFLYDKWFEMAVTGLINMGSMR